MKNKNKFFLTLKLSSLILLTRWLGQLPLSRSQSRCRTHFLYAVSDILQEVENKRLELLRIYAEKTDDGTPKVIANEDGTTKYDLTKEKMAKFTDDVNDYLANSREVEIEDAQLFNGIKKIILATDYKFAGDLAREYDIWCSALEGDVA